MSPSIPTSFESRLRVAAALLLSLPAIVAVACFAHGHGALGSYALLAVISSCMAAGATTAFALLRHAKRSTLVASRHLAVATQS